MALERGRVKIYRVLPNGHAITIYPFGPGDVFGFPRRRRRCLTSLLPVPASQLASAVGIAPESSSRAVTKLVGSGVLHRLGPRKLQVLDAAGLREAAGAY